MPSICRLPSLNDYVPSRTLLQCFQIHSYQLSVSKGNNFTNFQKILKIFIDKKSSLNGKLVKSKRCKSISIYNRSPKEASQLRDNLEYVDVEFQSVHEGTFYNKGKEKQIMSVPKILNKLSILVLISRF